MFENFFKKGKGQTSLEILIVMGGLIIIAVVVVTIILASSKSKVTQITDADKQNAEIIDKTLFPPNINSLVCVYENNQVTYNISIIPSVTKDISEYCLIVNGVKTDNCVPANQSQLSFTSSEVGNGNYKVALVSKNVNNGISSNSVGFSCKVDLPSGTGTTPPGGTTPGIANFDCPTGYVAVPGEALLGTTSSSYPQGGFCVMKWEAKVDINNDDIGDTNNQYLNCTSYYSYWFRGISDWYVPYYFYDTWNIDGNSTRKLVSESGGSNLLDTYYNANCSGNQTVCDCNLFNYTPNIDYKIVSSAEGQPLGRVDYASAKKFCEDIGPNYRLINNDEWMTIARNVESQPENWVGGLGTGALKKGNTCNQATTLFSYSVYGPHGGNLIDRLNSPGTGSNRGSNSPAKLLIANGKADREVWDLSGNMWEWVDFEFSPYQGPSIPGTTPGGWFEFDLVNNDGVFSPEQYKPINNMGSAQGAGKIYLNWTLTANHGLLRGGFNTASGWYGDCGHFTGLYSFFPILKNTNFYSKSINQPNTNYQQYLYSTYHYSSVGFRCVYIPQ